MFLSCGPESIRVFYLNGCEWALRHLMNWLRLLHGVCLLEPCIHEKSLFSIFCLDDTGGEFCWSYVSGDCSRRGVVQQVKKILNEFARVGVMIDVRCTAMNG